MRNKIKTILFYLVTLITLFFAFQLADFLTGFYKDIEIIRKDTSLFRSEAKQLEIQTQTLVPNIADSFINQQMSENFIRSVITDDYGIIKNPSYDERQQKKSKTILFLGGSTTENNEVDAEYRFPFLVGKLISQNTDVFVEGINAGVRGNTSQDSLNLYINHPSPFFKNSQYVVMMHNINDRLRLYIKDDYKTSIKQDRPSPTKHLSSSINYLSTSVALWIEETSNIGYLLINSLRRYFEPKGKKININENIIDLNAYEIPQEKINLFIQNIRNMIALTKANNQTLILVTQPIFKKSAAQDQLNTAIRMEASSSELILIDLADEILKYKGFRKNLFYDDGIHFNNLGSK